MSAASASGWRPVYRVVRRIPSGRVATYGQVAALAGMPGAARQVGWALSALTEDDDVPWHRVINARGEISPRGTRESVDLQRALLESEGVEMSRNGRIDLERYAWTPGSRRPRPERARESAAGDTNRSPAKTNDRDRDGSPAKTNDRDRDGSPAKRASRKTRRR